MTKQLRHRWDIVNLLQEHKRGLTLSQIVKHFDKPHKAKKGTPQARDEMYATMKLTAVIGADLGKLQKDEEVILLKGRYKPYL